METTTKYSGSTFKKGIQSIKKELKCWDQMKKLQNQLLDEILSENFDQVIKLAEAWKKLKPDALEAKLEMLRKRRENLKNILDYDIQHKEAILNADSVYRRANQEWRDDVVQAFKNRKLLEAEYQQLFREEDLAQLEYKKETTPLFEKLPLVEQVAQDTNKNLAKNLSKGYIKDPQLLKECIQNSFPLPKDLTIANYWKFIVKYNELADSNEKLPSSLPRFSTLVKKLFGLNSDGCYLSIDEIRKAIYSEGYEKTTRINNKEKVRDIIKRRFASPQELTFTSYENFARDHNSISGNEKFPTTFNWFSSLVNRLFDVKNNRRGSISIDEVRKTIYAKGWSGPIPPSQRRGREFFIDNRTGCLLTEEKYKELIERRKDGLDA